MTTTHTAARPAQLAAHLASNDLGDLSSSTLKDLYPIASTTQKVAIRCELQEREEW